MDLIKWVLTGSVSAAALLLGLLLYVLLVPQGRDTLLYWVSHALTAWQWGRRQRVASYVQKEAERFRAGINRDITGLIEAPLRIEWVGNENREQFLQDGKVVVRMRDHGARHKNLATATLLYIRGGVVPRGREYLGHSLSDAVDFTLSKMLLNRHQHEAALLFLTSSIAGPQVSEEPELRELCVKLEDVEQGALMTRVYLRELRDVTEFIYPRLATDADREEWLSFLQFLHSIATRERGGKVQLDFRGRDISVSFVPVAERRKASREGIWPYVQAAERAIDEGADVVYLSSFGQNHALARAVAATLEQGGKVRRVAHCPPRQVKHPFSNAPVDCSFIALHSGSRLRLGAGLAGLDMEETDTAPPGVEGQ